MKTGSILAFVGGLLIAVNSLLSLVLSLSGTLAVAGVSQTLLLSLGAISLLSGMVVLTGFYLTLQSRTSKIGSVLVIVFSSIAIVGGGGFVLGSILGIIGGALILSKK